MLALLVVVVDSCRQCKRNIQQLSRANYVRVAKFYAAQCKLAAVHGLVGSILTHEKASDIVSA